jgi:hypothetical protein
MRSAGSLPAGYPRDTMRPEPPISRRPRRLRAGVAAVAVAGLGVLPAIPASPAVAAPPAAVTVTPNTGLNQLWNSYGDQSGQWNGGDGTASVQLPDGRIAWLFSDTYFGPLNPDHSRSTRVRLVHNTIVVQSGATLGGTLHTGSRQAPRAVVEVPGFAWVADGIVENGSLKVLYNEYSRTGPGPLNVKLDRTLLATLSLPDMAVTSVQPLPLGNQVAWGQAIVNDCAYSYVYGTEHADGSTYAHLARAPLGNLGGKWQFWDGGRWSEDGSASARVLPGVGTAFGVTWADGKYGLVTQDNTVPAAFSASIVAYTAPSPAGPFGPPRELFRAPEAGADGKQIIVYDARVHPWLSAPGTMVVSYNVNSLNPVENNQNGTIYRPRFMNVSWPLPPG